MKVTHEKLELLTDFLSLPGAQFACPKNAKDGSQYDDERQCDKFYECNDGVPTTKLCPDGLVFDPTIRKINKCDQPFNVDCGDRTELRKYIIISIRSRLHPLQGSVCLSSCHLLWYCTSTINTVIHTQYINIVSTVKFSDEWLCLIGSTFLVAPQMVSTVSALNAALIFVSETD